VRLRDQNFKLEPIYFQWFKDVEDISSAEVLINHDRRNYRLLGSVNLLEDSNGLRQITGFSYAHKIIYSQPNLHDDDGLESYEKALISIKNFRKIYKMLIIKEDESDFITLEREFYFIAPIFLTTHTFSQVEKEITRILGRWINKISEITHDDDLVLMKKEEVMI